MSFKRKLSISIFIYQAEHIHCTCQYLTGQLREEERMNEIRGREENREREWGRQRG